MQTQKNVVSAPLVQSQPSPIDGATGTSVFDRTFVEDNELLERISRRDQSALETLYDRYATVLYSLCMAIVKKQEEAEQVVEEAFLQVWNKAPSYNIKKGSAYTWLVTLARNRAIDKLRSANFPLNTQKQPDFDFETMAGNGEYSPLDTTSFAERPHLVQQAFAELPAEQRNVLRMAYFEGLTQSEIAREMHLSPGIVNTYIRDGMKELHKLLVKNFV